MPKKNMDNIDDAVFVDSDELKERFYAIGEDEEETVDAANSESEDAEVEEDVAEESDEPKESDEPEESGSSDDEEEDVDDGYVSIDDYLEKNPQDESILSQFKGKEVPAEFLKSYVHSQREIGRKGNELGKARKEVDEAKKTLEELLAERQKKTEDTANKLNGDRPHRFDGKKPTLDEVRQKLYDEKKKALDQKLLSEFGIDPNNKEAVNDLRDNDPGFYGEFAAEKRIGEREILRDVEATYNEISRRENTREKENSDRFDYVRTKIYGKLEKDFGGEKSIDALIAEAYGVDVDQARKYRENYEFQMLFTDPEGKNLNPRFWFVDQTTGGRYFNGDAFYVELSEEIDKVRERIKQRVDKGDIDMPEPKKRKPKMMGSLKTSAGKPKEGYGGVEDIPFYDGDALKDAWDKAFER